MRKNFAINRLGGNQCYFTLVYTIFSDFLNQDVVVQGNPRVYKALKLELDSVLTELKRIEAGNSVDEELMNVIELISIILGGLKGEDENGK